MMVFVGAGPNTTNGREQILVMNGDGSNLRQLTNEIGGDYLIGYSQPEWSPDGSKIIFVRRLSNSGRYAYPALPSALFVINADGSNMVEISNRNPESFGDLEPAWQPLAAPSPELALSVLGFSTPQYRASGDADSLAVIVTRSGKTKGPVACDYSSDDRTGIRYRHTVSGRYCLRQMRWPSQFPFRSKISIIRKTSHSRLNSSTTKAMPHSLAATEKQL